MNWNEPTPDRELQKIRRFFYIGLLISLGFLIWPHIEDWFVLWQAEPRAVTARGSLAEDEQTTIEIFKNASPSVVYITTLSRYVNPWTRNIREVPKGTGSGFIWDEKGDVVTNWHVISEASSAQVRLNDKRVYTAVLIGASAEHDLAVLRINVPFNRPQPVPIGSSADLQVGQKVLAIGNPFGLDYTLTTGVISALNRSIDTENSRPIEHLIQTDAAINPGNSGGPLIDSAGRLIGINTAIYSPNGAYAGIGFAVPIDTVNRIIPKIIAQGRYVRPTLGIQVDDDVGELVIKDSNIEGVVVLRVIPGSAAERAGIVATQIDQSGEIVLGDVIQAVNDQSIKTAQDLLNVLETFEVGDYVTLKIYRNGEVITLIVGLEVAGTYK